MSTTKKSTEQVPFLERPIVRTILPIAGFVIICVLFAFLTDGRLFQPKNISLLLSQSYMLLISSIGVFMVMTMGGLDFSQGSMLGVASIVVCYLSHYNMVLAALGGVVTGGSMVTSMLREKSQASLLQSVPCICSVEFVLMQQLTHLFTQ